MFIKHVDSNDQFAGQVLHELLDLDDSLGEMRRQLAYEDTDGGAHGDLSSQNGGGIFTTMISLHRGWGDVYDNSGYPRSPTDSEYVSACNCCKFIFLELFLMCMLALCEYS